MPPLPPSFSCVEASRCQHSSSPSPSMTTTAGKTGMSTTTVSSSTSSSSSPDDSSPTTPTTTISAVVPSPPPGVLMLETARRLISGDMPPPKINRQQQQQSKTTTKVKKTKNKSKSNKTGGMATQSVLADSYVPHQYRAVNQWQVTFPMHAGPPISQASSMGVPEQWQHLYSTMLVPFTPICLCRTDNNKHIPTSDPTNQNVNPVVHHQFPLRMVPVELYDGLERTALTRPPPAGSPADLAMLPLPQATALDDDDDQNNSTTTTSSSTRRRTLADYCTTWESLLVRERQVCLSLFEQYSQYNVGLFIQMGSSLPGGTRRQTSKNGSSSHHPPVLASIQIDGIANVNPPLSVGDTVLIRPMTLVPVPSLQQQQYHPHPHHHQTQPQQQEVVEIRSTIHSISRQEGRIFFYWVTGHNEVLLRAAAAAEAARKLDKQKKKKKNKKHLAKPPPPPLFGLPRFNLRFIPTSQPVERTLTALDWFRSHAAAGAAPMNETRTSTSTSTALPPVPVPVPATTTTTTTTSPQDELLQFLFPTRAPTIPRCPNVRDLIRQRQQQQQLSSTAATTLNGNGQSGDSNTSATATGTAYSLHAELYRLNACQLDFVNMVTARTLHPAMDEIRGPAILTGPAGSGKTNTLILTILCVLNLMRSEQPSQVVQPVGCSTDSNDKSRQCHMLVCTPSHTAADVVTRRLGQHLGRHELFRLYDPSRPVETVQPEILQYCRQSTNQGGQFELPASPAELFEFKVIVCTCSDASILYRIGLTNQQLRIRRRCFERYLRQTCAGTNMDFSLAGQDQPHFTHLFVDEAAQATEPELLIPLSVVLDPNQPGSSRVNKAEVVLAGDPRQLSPDVYSAEAAAAGLNRSLMERLLQRPIQCLGMGHAHMLGPDLVQMDDWLAYSFQKDGQENLSVFLTMNYRCHPSILALPSALFYYDKLRSAGTEKHNGKVESFWCQKLRRIEQLSGPVVRPLVAETGTAAAEEQQPSVRAVPPEVAWSKQLSWPIHFFGVEGQDTSQTIKTGIPTTTWSNEAEASKLVEIVVSLVVDQGVQSEQIGVMAPFRGQVVLIRRLLRSRGLSAINVGTVEDYQAMERDVTLISLTRSTPTFVEDDVRRRVGVFGLPKRCNVALTRAENLLVVVGSPTVMATDPVWRQFLLFCLRNGLLYGDTTGVTDASLLQGWNPNKFQIQHRMDEPTNNDKRESSSRPKGDHLPSPGTTNIEPIVVGSLERVLRSSWV